MLRHHGHRLRRHRRGGMRRHIRRRAGWLLLLLGGNHRFLRGLNARLLEQWNKAWQE
jgi:hypothetical protein